MTENVGGAIARIRSKYETMTKTEKKIADKIFSSHKETVLSSIGIMARRCHVAESSIIRFSQTLGYSGFGELKMALAQDLSDAVTSMDLNKKDLSSPADVIDYMALASERAIRDTRNLLDKKVFQKAVTKIANAERVHFYGFGSSGDSAIIAKHVFMRFGMNVDCFTDNHYMSAVCNLTSKDVAVAISRTGNAEDAVYALRLARINKAATICITCSPGSEITEYSDYVLLAGTGMPQGNSRLILGRISELMVVNSLLLGVAMEKKQWDKELPSQKELYAKSLR